MIEEDCKRRSNILFSRFMILFIVCLRGEGLLIEASTNQVVIG